MKKFFGSLNCGWCGILASIFLAGVAQANSYPNPVSAQDTKAAVESSTAVLIDIREKVEVDAGMAEPAIWYPKSSIDTDENAFIAFLQKQENREIILYCRSGHRASIIVERLGVRGIKALNMGGFQDWVKAGYPTKKN